MIIQHKNLNSFIDCGVGNTPLIKANNLSSKFNVPIYLKLESTLPFSHTFKDRGALSAILKAKEEEKELIICASCGNMSASVVQIASRFGIKACAIVSEECNLPNKIAMKTSTAHIIEYNGRFDEIDVIISEYSEKNSDIPCINTNYMGYYAEGLKTLYYEIFQQLSEIHDEVNIIVPTADGTLIAALFHASIECKEMHPDIDFNPHFIVAQANLCSPIVEAYKNNSEISPWGTKQKTNVLSLSVEMPKIYGEETLLALKQTNGQAVAVNESKVQEYITNLGREEGIFTDDVGGICIGSLYELNNSNKLNAPTVCLMTGNGLKTYRKLTKEYEPKKSSQSDSLHKYLDEVCLS